MNNRMAGIGLVLMFALAVGAGVVAGKLSSHSQATATTLDGGTLSDQLRLSPDQRAKMQKIWEGVSATSQDYMEQAKLIQKEQDEAVLAMLTPDQRPKYQNLTIEAVDKVEKLKASRAAAFRDAVIQSNGILNESQRQIYMEIVKDRVGFFPDARSDRSGKAWNKADETPLAR